jgi:hypothetical protein
MCEQRSETWEKVRLGKITASEIHILLGSGCTNDNSLRRLFVVRQSATLPENKRRNKMTSAEFLKIVDERIEKVKKMLFAKAKEYAKRQNRMHNFYRAAGLLGGQPVAALRGMWIKHVVSINDIIDDINDGIPVKKSMLEEKITDNIAYLFLMDGLMSNNSLVIHDEPAKDINFHSAGHVIDDTPTPYDKARYKRGPGGRFNGSFKKKKK